MAHNEDVMLHCAADPSASVVQVRLITLEGKRYHVRHYLTSLRRMFDETRWKEERIEHLRTLAEGMSAGTGESVSGGMARDLADVQGEIEELADEYAGDLERYAREIAQGYVICPVESTPRYACWLHWAEGMTWTQVGNALRYSESHCRHNLCAQGVVEIYDAMPRKWRATIPDAI